MKRGRPREASPVPGNAAEFVDGSCSQDEAEDEQPDDLVFGNVLLFEDEDADEAEEADRSAHPAYRVLSRASANVDV